MSKLIREAIDHFIEWRSHHKKDHRLILQKTKGLWKDRRDLPTIEALRQEWDRSFDDSEGESR